MPPHVHRLETLRRQALAASQGLSEGQQALIDALHDLQVERGQAAEGYRAVVQSLTAALEARDGYTSDHSGEVQTLAVAVAAELGLTESEVAEVQAVAILHDIGKIGIPDRVLHKAGPLDDEEWALMREHPVIGERILRPLPGLAGVADAVRHEHERWDGSGYPDRLAGDAIPLPSRIVLACDAWHALVSDRPYRSALAPAVARAELERCSGTQFDPRVIEALLRCLEDPAPAGRPGDVLAAATDTGDELRALERELKALLSIASSVAGAHELDEVLDLAAEEARRALGANSLSISRWEGERDVLRTLINAGHLAPGEVRRPANETWRLESDDALRRLLLEGGSYIGAVDDPGMHPVERDLLLLHGCRSSVAVPIMFGGTAWGEMWATRAHGRPDFSERDLRFLQAIAGQLATAIGRAELFSQMADLALKDDLTGVANRRAFEERLEVSVAGALAADRELALVLCDVDHLKVLNDAGGHEAGDAALRRAADVLRELAAPVPRALVARLGGDELGVLIEDGDRLTAKALAAAALERLATGPDPVSLSCGIATLKLGAETPADLLRAADAALYHAKRGGRGRAYGAASDPRMAWREAAPGRRRRRARRDATAEAVDVAGLLREVVHKLDGPLATSTAAERLEALVSACATAVNATAGALSLQAPGDPELVTLVTVDRRMGSTTRHGDGEGGDEDERYVVSEFPATERLLEHGGSAVWRSDDQDSDTAERVLLEEWGMDAALAVAGSDDHGAWLLEVYADGQTADVALIEPAARALVLHCLYGGVPSDLNRSRAISAAARADTFAWR